MCVWVEGEFIVWKWFNGKIFCNFSCVIINNFLYDSEKDNWIICDLVFLFIRKSGSIVFYLKEFG